MEEETEEEDQENKLEEQDEEIQEENQKSELEKEDKEEAEQKDCRQHCSPGLIMNNTATTQLALVANATTRRW